MKSICVYLGANPGNNTNLIDIVSALGKLIASKNMNLVYGGSSLGLMGILANAALANNGSVTGIITEHLIEREKPLTTLNELIIVNTMQERKLLLQQRADAFIVLPGGLGSLEETFETWSAIKLGLIKKPIGFLNVDGYYDNLFLFISSCVKNGFITDKQAQIPKIHENPEILLSSIIKESERYFLELTQ